MQPSDFHRHAAWLRPLAAALVRGPGEADDVVQETLLAAGQKPPRLAGAVEPWLRGVLRNIARMRNRTSARRQRRDALVAAQGVEAPPSAEELLARYQLAQRLAAMVAALDEPYRSTLQLSYQSGMSPSEIATSQGVPPGTVRWRLKHGLDEIRGHLDREHEGGRRAWLGMLVPQLVPASKTASETVWWAAAPKSIPKLVGLCALLFLFAFCGLFALRTSKRPHEDVKAGSPAAVAMPFLLAPLAQGSSIASALAQPGVAAARIAGIVTKDGVPFSGARVRLSPADMELAPSSGQDVETNAQGHFDFSVQAPARYRVSATSDGFIGDSREVDLRQPGVDAQAMELALSGCDNIAFGRILDAEGIPVAGARIRGATVDETGRQDGSYEVCVPSGPSKFLVEAPGYAVASVNVYGVRAGKRLRSDVTLTPEARIVGQVVRADDGAPVSGVYVIAQLRAGQPDIAGATGMGRADDSGQFQITGLSAGVYHLSVNGNEYGTDSPIELTVQATQVHGSLVLRVSPRRELQGQLVTASGPVAGAFVTLLSETGEALLAPSAVSQRDGRFRIGHVPRMRFAWDVKGYQVDAPAYLDVAKGDASKLVVVHLQELARIFGRVTLGGKPAPKARVGLDQLQIYTQADEEGRYELRGVPAGRFRMWANNSAVGAFADYEGVQIKTGESKLVDLELTQAGVISGVVTDEEGKPVSGVLVRAKADDHDEDEVETDAEGKFSAGCLKGNATYRLTVRPVDQPHRTLQPAGTAHPEVTLASGADQKAGVQLVVKLTRSTIEGFIVDAQGSPVADARVVATPEDMSGANFTFSESPSAVTDQRGHFALPGLTAGGAYNLKAVAPRGIATKAVQNAGVGGPVTLVLANNGRVIGQLLGFQDAPIVRAERDGDSAVAQVEGDTFEIENLVPGRYVVTARSASGGGHAEVDVRSGETARADLKNRGVGTIEGRVTDFASGAPIVAAVCQVLAGHGRKGDWGKLKGARTDGNGFFRTSAAVGAGTVTCTSPSGGYSSAVGYVDVPQEPAVHVEFALVRNEVPYQKGGDVGISVEDEPQATASSVRPDFAAASAGVKVGDAILAVGDRSVTKLSGDGVQLLIRNQPVGSNLRLVLQQPGESPRVVTMRVPMHRHD